MFDKYLKKMARYMPVLIMAGMASCWENFKESVSSAMGY